MSTEASVVRPGDAFSSVIAQASRLVFEWLVEARHDGTCIVRVMNTGLVAGKPWDDPHAAMTEGWKLLMLNVKFHLQYLVWQRMIETQVATERKERA
jgi:hypothetical protein